MLTSVAASWVVVASLLFEPLEPLEPVDPVVSRCRDANELLATCSANEHLSLGFSHCFPGGLVVHARFDDGPGVQVEIRSDDGPSLVRQGRFGVSPVGEFPDWNQEPTARRQALAEVVRCLEAVGQTPAPPPDPHEWGEDRTSSEQHVRHGTDDPEHADPEHASAEHGTAGHDEGDGWHHGDEERQHPKPWLVLVGVLCTWLTLGLCSRRLGWQRAAIIRAVIGLAALTVVTFFVRALWTPADFLHQNGHGPSWIEYAACGANPAYGPGFEEVFGWLARRVPSSASEAVFSAQASAAAFGPAFAWAIARCVGCRPITAASLAALVAIEPVLARIVQSESYFATGSTLLLWATALLAMGARGARWSSFAFWIGAGGAAALVAQAARIHPLVWLPCALVPLVLLGGPETIRRRLGRAALAAAIIGIISTILVLPVMQGIVGGDTGNHWLDDFFDQIPIPRLHLAHRVAVVGAVVVVGLARDRKEGLLAASAWGAVILTIAYSHIISAVFSIIVWSYPMLFLGPFISVMAICLAAIDRSPRQASLVAATLLGVGLLSAATRSGPLMRRATDVLEQRYLLRLARDLPPDATVAYLASSPGGPHLAVPLLGGCIAGSPWTQPMTVEDPSSLEYSRRPTYWYRSGLCSTAGGRDFCDSVESTNTLVELDSTELPARESLEGLGYDAATVRVALYRVEPSS